MSDAPRSNAPAEFDRYEIRLLGRLDDRWSEWFEGLKLAAESGGTTVLVGDRKSVV